MSAFVHCCIDQ